MSSVETWVGLPFFLAGIDLNPRSRMVNKKH